jgi:hypothetical protein
MRSLFNLFRPATTNSNLVGSIKGVTLFSPTVLSFDDGGSIDHYIGFRLYCQYTVDTAGVLRIILADASSSIVPTGPPGAHALQATVELHYRGSVKAIMRQPVAVDYKGGMLAVGVTIDATSKWQSASLIVNIEEKALAVDDKRVEAPGFVITDATSMGKGFQLRWIDNPVTLATAPVDARPIAPTSPADPTVPPPGAGVSGPMGIDAP